MKKLRLLLALLAASLVCAALPAATLAEAQTAADTALARNDLTAYRGWIKFLRFEAETAVARHGADSPQAKEKTDRLADWVQRIAADPQLLGKLRGVQEWAYESPADGSGQPFKLVIPSDYDAARPTPLSVSMHGYSGNHLEHSTGAAPHDGNFEAYVLGRGRGGWYTGLSQADVLHVIDYIEAHWNIDARRIHLGGGSMGGGATFKLGSRYPHRFASGQITCGYTLQEAFGNLATFPIYATHSDDDPVVPVMHAHSAYHQLREAGNQVIFDRTNGYGHAVWDYADGNARSAVWGPQQVLPLSTDVRHIDFTALDCAAVRGWWAEVAQWGPAPKPARFVLTACPQNLLQADLTNVDALRLRLAESPLDRTQPLQISVNGAVPFTVAAPLPESLVLVRQNATWTTVAALPADPRRMHTPGGPIQVYDGSPLLIVYGTHGDATTQAALRTAAEAASKTSHSEWAEDAGETGPDGIYHEQNLYGRLPIKADTAVTEADLKGHNLVLIGTASENAVVARLAAQLPVQFADGKIRCSDGAELPGAGAMLGLVHYNPVDPQRLLFWVAADTAAAYAPGAVVPAFGREYFFGADLYVADTASGALRATRSFDNAWAWTPDRETSPLIPARLASNQDLAMAVAEATRLATGADFAAAHRLAPLGDTAITAGVTRLADIEPLFYHNGIDVIEVTGAELLAVAPKLAPQDTGWRAWMRLTPALDTTKIDPARRYRIALPMFSVGPLGRATLLAPRVQQRTGLFVDDALLRHFEQL
jgi:hypothetical protein